MSENSFLERVEKMLASNEQSKQVFTKMTQNAKQVLVMADEEAQLLDHNYIGTEHILLGLIRVNESIAGIVLKDLGIELHLVRTFVERVVKRGSEPLPPDTPRKIVPRVYVILGLASNEAWRSSFIGTEHILLGLVREGEGIGAAAIETLGVTLDQVRKRVYQAMLNSGQPVESLKTVAKSKNNVVACRIDDEDLEAIDALVEVGIRSTRSDAASWLIHAGIQANTAVLESVYKTVADIRDLRTKAQALVGQVMKSDNTPPASEARGPEDRKPPEKG